MNKLALALILLPSLAGAHEVVTRVVLTPGRLHEATLAMDGFTRAAVPGQPGLPERDVAVALHPRADLSTLKIAVKSGPTDSLAGRRSLAPRPPHLLLWPDRVTRSWDGAGTVIDGRDVAAYAGDPKVVFPREVVRRGQVTNRRGLLVLHLSYTPLRYRHAAGELLLDRHTELELRYRLTGDAPFPPDPELLPFFGEVANPAQARLWHQAGRADTTTPPGYVIVIEDKLRQASQALDAFVKQKEQLGFKVHLVTEKDLAAVSVGPAGGDAERIRGWLQQYYKSLGLRYVLLVGNPDPDRPGVPMKLTYAMIKGQTYKLLPPSDHYYADLNGNWDLDGDGQVAEYPEDDGPGGIDFTPEVYVGRIPVYGGNVAALDKILKKTMRYVAETGERAWRKRVLQPAAMLFFANEGGKQSDLRMDGATMADAIYDQVIKQHGLSRFTLFEEEGVDPSKLTGDAALTTENMIAEWKKGYGLVTWFGHGSAEAVYRKYWESDDGNGVPDYDEIEEPALFSYDDTIQLDDTHPSFVFHGSCSNGRPDAADNVAYGLLRHGAIGTVGSSDLAVVLFATGSIELSSANIFGAERDFTAGLLDNKPAGEALFYAKDKISLKIGMYSWLTRLQLNLYGDPSVALTSCVADADCDDGKACNGAEVCQAGQCGAGTAVACSSGDPCIEATCDEQTGKCSVRARPNGEPCDDGKFCTVDEVCNGGQCRGQARCAAPNNPCVAARCDEVEKTCDVFSQPEGETCHEGSDREGTCQAGICEPDDTGCDMGHGATSPLALLLLVCAPGLVASARRRRRR